MAEALAASSRQDLLIGIGNSLRGDDGVGRQLACWAERRWPALAVHAVQQLTPELSIPLAQARRALFVDACRVPPLRQGAEPLGDGQGAPRLLALAPLPGAGAAIPDIGAFSHHLDPHQLLTITALLEGRVPPAWLLLVPAFRFGHGEALSAGLRAVLPGAQALLRDWCDGETPEAASAAALSVPWT